MSKSNRFDTKHERKLKSVPTIACRRLCALALAIIFVTAPIIEAQAGNARRAIEDLEGCSDKERAAGCINILKRESAGKGKQRIKAQVRGGRIIWYEFDSKSGRVSRSN